MAGGRTCAVVTFINFGYRQTLRCSTFVFIAVIAIKDATTCQLTTNKY